MASPHGVGGLKSVRTLIMAGNMAEARTHYPKIHETRALANQGTTIERWVGKVLFSLTGPFFHLLNVPLDDGEPFRASLDVIKVHRHVAVVAGAGFRLATRVVTL